jgi:hypothetical protein
VVSNGIEGFLIPDVAGDTYAEARFELEKLGLVISIVEEYSDAEPGLVLSTDPVAGVQAMVGDPIIVRVATEAPGDTLIDFRLAGRRVVIEPRYTSTTAGDVSFETARRLSSLFQAAGASVTVTRLSNEAQVGTSMYEERAAAARPDLFIVLLLSDGEREGLVVRTPSTDEGSVGQQVFERLRGHFPESTALRTVDIFSPAPANMTVSVTLGSTSSANDQLLFGDAQWSDRVARAIYMAGGEALSFATP